MKIWLNFKQMFLLWLICFELDGFATLAGNRFLTGSRELIREYNEIIYFLMYNQGIIGYLVFDIAAILIVFSVLYFFYKRNKWKTNFLAIALCFTNVCGFYTWLPSFFAKWIAPLFLLLRTVFLTFFVISFLPPFWTELRHFEEAYWAWNSYCFWKFKNSFSFKLKEFLFNLQRRKK